MPWELMVIKPRGNPPARETEVAEGDRAPLGAPAHVRWRCEQAFPQVRWSEEPGDSPSLRLEGYAQGEDGTSFGLAGYGRADEVDALLIDVRGAGNPFPELRRLCEPEGWTVYEMQSGCPRLDLTQDRPPNFTPADLPTSSTVTRADIAAVLRRWQSGELTAVQVQQWASARYSLVDLDFDDWEPGKQDSVACDVLGALDMLGVNYILPGDLPTYLAFLETPVGRYTAGRKRLSAAQDKIDYQQRERDLRGIWPYDLRAAPK